MVQFERENARVWAETKSNVQHQLNLFDMYQYQICPQLILEMYSDEYQLLAQDRLFYPIESSLLRLCQLICAIQSMMFANTSDKVVVAGNETTLQKALTLKNVCEKQTTTIATFLYKSALPSLS